jgi:hypothetical protein
VKRIKSDNLAPAQEMPAPLDPRNVNGRLYEAISKLLDNFDDMTVREQVATVAAIARIQVLFQKIREEQGAIPSSAGTTVKRYAKAFEAHAARGRKAVAGSEIPLLDASYDDSDELEY